MGILEKKGFRILFHFLSTVLTLVLIIVLSDIRALSDPPGIQFLIFLIIPQSIWYFLYDREHNEGKIANIIYFITMGILALVVLIAGVAGGSTYAGYEGKISLIQYAALASTPIALVISAFAFMIINNHFSDKEFLYPFIPSASCILGFLIGIPVSAIGYALPFMFIGGGFIFLGIAAIAYIIYLKKTDLPFSGYYKEFGSSRRSSRNSRPSYTGNSSSTSTGYSAPAAPKTEAIPAAPKPASTTTPRDNAKQELIDSLRSYYKYFSSSCCGERVKMDATVETVFRGGNVQILIPRFEIDTYKLEQEEFTPDKIRSLQKELKDRVYYFKLSINETVNNYYRNLLPKVRAYNREHLNDQIDLESETLEY